MTQDQSVSLNKFISDTGRCSRREADRLIEAGRVKLNGQVAKKGNRAAPGDTVHIDGILISGEDNPETVYILLNKPAGIVCTTDPGVKNNIAAYVNYPQRVFPVGRLDKASEGLIILTNDGNAVNKILRAGNQHEKEYLVAVNLPITDAFIQRMAQGVPILGTVTEPCTIEKTGSHSFRIILTQGLNRQIRRMCEYLGYVVTSLRRVRIMHLKTGTLKTGSWRLLTPREVKTLHFLIRNSSKTAG